MDMNEIICPTCKRIFNYDIEGSYHFKCPHPSGGNHFYISFKARTKIVFNLFIAFDNSVYKFGASPDKDLLYINGIQNEFFIQRPTIDIDNLQETVSYLQELVKLKAFL